MNINDIKEKFNKLDMFKRSYWVQRYLCHAQQSQISWSDEKQANKFYEWLYCTISNAMELADNTD